jgi:hypothetical protein
MKFFLFIATIWILTGCHGENNTLTQEDIEKRYLIEYLKNETYYFPAKQHSNDPTVYLPLQPFDFIFTGHDFNSSHATFAYATPGHYTHMLMYLGKDDEGFAYGVEINVSPEDKYTINRNGLQIDGRLYVYCLGSDFGQRECPKNLYHNGLQTYDYMWSKRLTPPLHQKLLENRPAIIETIKEDLINAFPAQLPFYFNWNTLLIKKISLIDDGRKNGADCTAYFTSLLEEKAKICLENARMDAEEIESYYINDPIGQQAKIPEQYNFFSDGDLYITSLFTQRGYSLINTSRPTNCETQTIVSGIPVPDRLFHSPDLENITPY